MKRLLIAISLLALAILACATGPTTPKPSLYPSATPEITQTPFVVKITTTPNATYTPFVVVVSETPNASSLCVNALVAVYLRPSPSDDNYPIVPLPNGSQLDDLGGRSGKWFFVQYQDKQGWINSDYLEGCNE